MSLRILRNASPRNTPCRRSEWGCSLPPDWNCLHSKHCACKCFLTWMFYREGLLASRPIPKLEDHPLSAVHDCLFNLFAATLHIGGCSSIRNLRTRHAVVTGTHYTWNSKPLPVRKLCLSCITESYSSSKLLCQWRTYHCLSTFLAVSEVTSYKICLLWKCVQDAKIFVAINEMLNATLTVINPSARGHLNPSSYCDVGRFFSGYLNFELNRAGVY